ncbi:uncharacterized protein LOC144100664 [Amblyomma americanum]
MRCQWLLFRNGKLGVDLPDRWTSYGVNTEACRTKITKNNLALPLGIAAYDIEYDAEESPFLGLNLGRGQIRRVRMLKNMRDFFKDGLRDCGQLESCFTIT